MTDQTSIAPPTEQTAERRPQTHSEAVLKAAIRESLPAILKWLGDDEDADEIADQIYHAMRSEQDSYRIARHLDINDMWEVDFELVEIIDQIDIERHQGEAVRAWVIRNNITLPYAPGDTVMWRGAPHEVVDLRPDTAQLGLVPIPRTIHDKSVLIVPVEKVRRPD